MNYLRNELIITTKKVMKYTDEFVQRYGYGMTEDLKQDIYVKALELFKENNYYIFERYLKDQLARFVFSEENAFNTGLTRRDIYIDECDGTIYKEPMKVFEI